MTCNSITKQEEMALFRNPNCALAMAAALPPNPSTNAEKTLTAAQEDHIILNLKTTLTMDLLL